MKTLLYFSCDGSFEVESAIETDISQGVHRGAGKYVFDLQYFALLKHSFTSTYISKNHAIIPVLNNVV